MARYKVYGTKKPWDKKLSFIEVMTSKKLTGRRLHVKIPGVGNTIGFYSYDNKGIVYKYPGGMVGSWCFFPIIKYQRLKWNTLPGLWGGKRKYFPGAGRFQLSMNKAIHTEIQVCQDLETKFKHLNVVRLPHSGIYAGGSDIIITDEKITEMDVSDDTYKIDVKRKVDHAIIGIEVLGLHKRPSGKYRFTYPAHKDFIEYRSKLYDRNVIPVIAWIEPENKVYYMPLWSEDDIKAVFWTNHNKKKYGYRQRQNYAPLEHTSALKLDIEQFYAEFQEYDKFEG